MNRYDLPDNLLDEAPDVGAFLQLVDAADSTAITAAFSIMHAQAALITALSRRLRKLNTGTGLTLSRAKILSVLYLSDEDGVPQVTLGEYLGSTSALMTHLLNGLEKDGLIQRGGDLNDRRVNIVRLTDLGGKMAAEAGPAIVDVIHQSFQDVSEDDMASVLIYLNKVRARAKSLH